MALMQIVRKDDENMKYEEPVMEIIVIKNQDIVTLSGTEGGNTDLEPSAPGTDWDL